MVKRKTRSVPTRIWAYGSTGPLDEDAELVSSQLLEARKYQNALIEIERWRAQRFREMREAAHPALVRAQHALELDISRLAETRKEIKDERARTRYREASSLLVARAKRLRQQVDDQKLVVKLERAKADRMVTTDDKATLQAEYLAKRRAAYGSSPAYWGTKLLVAKAVEAAVSKKRKDHSGDVEFHPWTTVVSPHDGSSLGGTASIGVQIAKKHSIEDIMCGKFSGVKIELGRRIEGGRHRAILTLRVDDEFGEPRWARFHFVYHRPIPPNSRITWVQVKRERHGLKRFKWSVLFYVESEVFESPARLPSHSASVNLGWRLRHDGSLRVGYVVGSDGAKEEVLCPESVRKIFEFASVKQGYRDVALQELKQALADITIGVGDDDVRTEFAALRHSKSFRRYAAMAYRLRSVDPGDDVTRIMVAWAKRDAHLEGWIADEVRHAVLKRREVYRLAARDLCKRYSTIILDDTDHARLKLRKEAEDLDDEMKRARRLQRQQAAPGELRQAIVLMASNLGTTIKKGASRDAPTARCHVCSEACAVGDELMHVCEHCGAQWDVDENFCQNVSVFSGTAGAAE